MPTLKELIILLQLNFVFLKINELNALYKSLIEETSCVWYPNQKKSFLSNLYNSNWLKSNLPKIQKQIEKWENKDHIQIHTFKCPTYPQKLFNLKNPPLCLYTQGEANFNIPTLAIVGRREAKPYTLKWLDDHLPSILNKKINIISGGARGVDAKAHQLAILNACKTTYVIPSGLLDLYPSSLKAYALDLIQSGACFISSYPPNTPMRKQNFSNRNLIIACLCDKILILEAEIRSGTYMTAKYAVELNVDIGVIPSFPSDSSYSGSLQLIYDGAQMIRNKQDLEIFFS